MTHASDNIKSPSSINNSSMRLSSKAIAMQNTLKKLLSSNNNLRKILKKTNISIKDVQFIALQKFIQQNQMSINSNDQYSDNFDYRDRYETQLSRRITQLKILMQMEHIHFDHHQKRNLSLKKDSIVKQYDLNRIQQKSSKKQSNKKKSPVKNNDRHSCICEAKKSMRSARSGKNHSTQSSQLSRQHSNIELQTHKKIQEVQIFQTFTEGKPYIEQYCKSARIYINKSQMQRLKNPPQLQTSPRSHQYDNQIGKITKQIVLKKTSVVQNQYQNSPYSPKNKKQLNSWIKNKQKKNQIYLNSNDQYEIIPLKNQTIKEKLTRKIFKNSEKQREVCKQLISEVKRYEQINKKCIKKLKSIDKNDFKSREKILQMTSKQKTIKKDNIQRLKNRIASNHQNNR